MLTSVWPVFLCILTRQPVTFGVVLSLKCRCCWTGWWIRFLTYSLPEALYIWTWFKKPSSCICHICSRLQKFCASWKWYRLAVSVGKMLSKIISTLPVTPTIAINERDWRGKRIYYFSLFTLGIFDSTLCIVSCIISLDSQSISSFVCVVLSYGARGGKMHYKSENVIVKPQKIASNLEQVLYLKLLLNHPLKAARWQCLFRQYSKMMGGWGVEGGVHVCVLYKMLELLGSTTAWCHLLDVCNCTYCLHSKKKKIKCGLQTK